MQLGGFSAWITVEGDDQPKVRIDEYGERTESEKHITCWIPSAVGKRFAIHWCDHMRRQTAGYCYIDGSSVGGKVIREPWRTNTAKHDAFQLTGTTSTPFQFSKLELTDDDFYFDKTAEKVKNMGVINLKLFEVIPGLPRLISNPSGLPEMTNKVHEKSKKGLVHGVSFGGVRQSHVQSTTVDVQFVDNVPVVFTFRYRPLDVLRAEGIAPLPNTSKVAPSSSQPKASSSKLDPPKESTTGEKRKASEPVVIDLSDEEDEIAELEAKLERAKARKAALSPSKKVKKEHKPTVLSDVVIDLT